MEAAYFTLSDNKSYVNLDSLFEEGGGAKAILPPPPPVYLRRGGNRGDLRIELQAPVYSCIIKIKALDIHLLETKYIN